MLVSLCVTGIVIRIEVDCVKDVCWLDGLTMLQLWEMRHQVV